MPEHASYLSGAVEYDEAGPEGFRAGVVRVGELAGGRALAVKAFEVPPARASAATTTRSSDMYYSGQGLGTDCQGSERQSA